MGELLLLLDPVIVCILSQAEPSLFPQRSPSTFSLYLFLALQISHFICFCKSCFLSKWPAWDASFLSIMRDFIYIVIHGFVLGLCDLIEYLCMNEWQRRAFSFSTRTLKRVWWVKLSSYHIHTEMYSRQPIKIKVRVFEDSAEEIFVQQNEHTTIMKPLFFLRNDHTTCFNFNSKFPLSKNKHFQKCKDKWNWCYAFIW